MWNALNQSKIWKAWEQLGAWYLAELGAAAEYGGVLVPRQNKL